MVMETKFKIVETENYVLAVSDKDIKEGDYQLVPMISKVEKATKDNIHLSYMCYKIIAYKPKGDAPKLDLPLLPDVEDDVEKLADKANGYLVYSSKAIGTKALAFNEGFIEGYKTATKVYSEDDVTKLMTLAWDAGFKKHDVVEAGLEGKETDIDIRWILSKFKYHKTSKWFVTEIEKGYRTNPDGEPIGLPVHNIGLKTTTINGKNCLVGAYAY